MPEVGGCPHLQGRRSRRKAGRWQGKRWRTTLPAVCSWAPSAWDLGLPDDTVVSARSGGLLKRVGASLQGKGAKLRDIPNVSAAAAAAAAGGAVSTARAPAAAAGGAVSTARAAATAAVPRCRRCCCRAAQLAPPAAAAIPGAAAVRHALASPRHQITPPFSCAGGLPHGEDHRQGRAAREPAHGAVPPEGRGEAPPPAAACRMACAPLGRFVQLVCLRGGWRAASVLFVDVAHLRTHYTLESNARVLLYSPKRRPTSARRASWTLAALLSQKASRCAARRAARRSRRESPRLAPRPACCCKTSKGVDSESPIDLWLPPRAPANCCAGEGAGGAQGLPVKVAAGAAALPHGNPGPAAGQRRQGEARPLGAQQAQRWQRQAQMQRRRPHSRGLWGPVGTVL